jgi:cold shock protein
MANGTVKWFNGQKGYGFIQPEEGGADVFVHISAVERAGLQTLREGQKIAYETERGRNGKIAAVNLRPLESTNRHRITGSGDLCSP